MAMSISRREKADFLTSSTGEFTGMKAMKGIEKKQKSHQ